MKNENNSSKQRVLSIVAILVLLFAVVGVSFAFFNYSKVGEENNVIQTGSVFFNFSETNVISLKNQYPMSDKKGKALGTGNTGLEPDKIKDYAIGNVVDYADTEVTEAGVLDFTVVGFDSSTKGIDYTIYAIEGALPKSKKPIVKDGAVVDGEQPYTETDRLKDNDIKLFLTVGEGGANGLKTNNFGDNSGSMEGEPAVIASHLNKSSDASKTLGKGTVLKDGTIDGAIIATGHVRGGGVYTKTSPQEDHYKLRMWISDDVQLISDDTDPKNVTAKNEASVIKTSEFGGKYYSIKILIDAKTGTTDDTKIDISVPNQVEPILGSKTISDLQSNVTVVGNEITGVSKYVTNFQEFNPTNSAEQSGNYIVLDFPEAKAGIDVTVQLKGGSTSHSNPVTLTKKDSVLIARIADNNVTIEATAKGKKTRVLNVKKLILNPDVTKEMVQSALTEAASTVNGHMTYANLEVTDGKATCTISEGSKTVTQVYTDIISSILEVLQENADKFAQIKGKEKVINIVRGQGLQATEVVALVKDVLPDIRPTDPISTLYNQKVTLTVVGTDGDEFPYELEFKEAE